MNTLQTLPTLALTDELKSCKWLMVRGEPVEISFIGRAPNHEHLLCVSTVDGRFEKFLQNRFTIKGDILTLA